MPAPKKLLIADPDPATARLLAPALRRLGWVVHAARDGSRALQLAVLRFPDLVLFDERCPLVDARAFARILRTNPRTSPIPVVVMGSRTDPDRARLGAFLSKPLREEDVLARVEQIYRRGEAARAVAEGGRELSGQLQQVPLVDLLQVLGMNRKSGRLALGAPGEACEIRLRDGKVAGARAGPVIGEKALYRLLGRREGSFSFTAGEVEGELLVDRRMDELVMDGLRQVDEAAALRPSLPGPGEALQLAVDPAELPPDLHPVTAEVVALLERPRNLPALLDAARSTDLEVLRAVAALLEQGWARRGPAERRPGGSAILAPAELHRLRGRIGRGRPAGAPVVGKVLVTGGGPLARRAALASLATLPGWAPEAEPAVEIGTFGRVEVGEGVGVEVCALPPDPESLPLWRAFGAGAVGALVLLPADGMAEVVRTLRDLQIPVAICGPSMESAPAALSQSSAAVFGGGNAAGALCRLLAGEGRWREPGA